MRAFYRMKFSEYKTRIIVTAGAVAVLGLVGTGMIRYRIGVSQSQKKTEQATPTKDIDALIADVGRLIILPSEEPTIASVVDPETLKREGPAFYAHAEVGDKALVYPVAKKAILYRPSVKKIVEVMSLTAQASPVQPTQETARPLRFVLLNATSTVGLTQTFEKELKKTLPDAVVTGRDTAESNRAQSIVVAVKGTAEQAKDLAQKLSMKTGDLPEGETKPAEDVDFVIILGADRK